MKKALVIADSGGSKTDWCLKEAGGEVIRFSTESYHPKLFTSAWIEDKKTFWEQYTSHYELEVTFYGSGCVNTSQQEVVKRAFRDWGIEHVRVFSDVLGAAHACSIFNNGFIGILGTGSVLAAIKQGDIHELYGGFGPVLGDEGSGYYFGVLLLKNYLNKSFSQETMAEIEHQIGIKSRVLETVYSNQGKAFIAGLSGVFSSSINIELQRLHQQNLRVFLDNYLPATSENKSVSFVGSYAFHLAELLKIELDKRGWKLDRVIQKPIEYLV
jgi:glucosamine kinase